MPHNLLPCPVICHYSIDCDFAMLRSTTALGIDGLLPVDMLLHDWHGLKRESEVSLTLATLL